MPSFIKMAKSLAGTTVDVVKHAVSEGEVLASKEEVKKRLEACKASDGMQIVAGLMQCKGCGCFCAAKSKLKAASCASGNW